MSLGMPEVVLILFVLGFALLGTAFWIWMLIDCATKESSQGNDKVVWIIIIALTHIIGGAIYFFVRRPQRKTELGR
jgi:hypothetical protein